jgi:hypothetical protein
MPNQDPTPTHLSVRARLGRKRHIKLTRAEILALNPVCLDCRKQARYYSRYLGQVFYECETCHQTRGPEGLAELFRLG